MKNNPVLCRNIFNVINFAFGIMFSEIETWCNYRLYTFPCTTYWKQPRSDTKSLRPRSAKKT